MIAHYFDYLGHLYFFFSRFFLCLNKQFSFVRECICMDEGKNDQFRDMKDDYTDFFVWWFEVLLIYNTVNPSFTRIFGWWIYRNWFSKRLVWLYLVIQKEWKKKILMEKVIFGVYIWIKINEKNCIINHQQKIQLT